MSDKEKYREYCKTADNLIIFQNDWWLDAVCGENNWDALVYVEKDAVRAVWAFPFQKKFGFPYINMPRLTFWLGPAVNYTPKQRPGGMVTQEHEAMEYMIERLPKYNYFSQRFPVNIKNHLPFFWKKFLQTTRYTYRIKDLSDLEKAFQNVDPSLRNKIRKAEKTITVEETLDVALFYRVAASTFTKQGKKMPYSLQYLQRIEDACRKRNCSKFIIARDAEGNVHSATYIVWDKHCAYYLLNGSDEKYKNSGANTLLMWESIKRMSGITPQFDFCGSMIPPIERFFRSFGGEQMPYFQIKNVKPAILKALLPFAKG